MGYAFMLTAAAMFLIPMFTMLSITLVGMEIPTFILHKGAWSMVFGALLAGVGAAIALVE